ncbi:MAG: prepilin-type N-terminal cleavage/methylation domain-containing protein [Clostridium sp.]|nr:prepilin-type N-terminal cleavage/methylation domain-containing protein [Clostridium sp.]
MIKRKNGKKKGFSLIELIIVLAVMAIIALIAIPNFTAVKKNSANKADEQSCETIDRAVLMLVSDETVKVTDDAVLNVTFSNGKVDKVEEPDKVDLLTGEDAIKEALGEVKAPQGKAFTISDGKVTHTEDDATKYSIKVNKDGTIEVVTIK